MPSLEPPGENAVPANGYRNGTYTRDLVTSTGRLEEIKVPRDRAGHFHTQAFEHYSRYEPHIADGLMQMFVAGTNTHKVGKSLKPMGLAPSASTISRLNQSLSHQLRTGASVLCRALACLVSGWCTLQHPSWRQGRFNDHFDGLRSGSGRKTKRSWRSEPVRRKARRDGSVCQDLRGRGATQIDLIVTDGHDGVLAAVAQLFAATPRQPAAVWSISNAYVLNAIPKMQSVAMSRPNEWALGSNRQKGRL